MRSGEYNTKEYFVALGEVLEISYSRRVELLSTERSILVQLNLIVVISVILFTTVFSVFYKQRL